MSGISTLAGVETPADGRVVLIVEGVAPAVMSVRSGEGVAVTVGPPAAWSEGCSEGLKEGFSNMAGAGEIVPVFSCGVRAAGFNGSFTNPDACVVSRLCGLYGRGVCTDELGDVVVGMPVINGFA